MEDASGEAAPVQELLNVVNGILPLTEQHSQTVHELINLTDTNIEQLDRHENAFEWILDNCCECSDDKKNELRTMLGLETKSGTTDGGTIEPYSSPRTPSKSELPSDRQIQDLERMMEEMKQQMQQMETKQQETDKKCRDLQAAQRAAQDNQMSRQTTPALDVVPAAQTTSAQQVVSAEQDLIRREHRTAIDDAIKKISAEHKLAVKDQFKINNQIVDQLTAICDAMTAFQSLQQEMAEKICMELIMELFGIQLRQGNYVIVHDERTFLIAEKGEVGSWKDLLSFVFEKLQSSRSDKIQLESLYDAILEIMTTSQLQEQLDRDHDSLVQKFNKFYAMSQQDDAYSQDSVQSPSQTSYSIADFVVGRPDGKRAKLWRALLGDKNPNPSQVNVPSEGRDVMEIFWFHKTLNSFDTETFKAMMPRNMKHLTLVEADTFKPQHNYNSWQAFDDQKAEFFERLKDWYEITDSGVKKSGYVPWYIGCNVMTIDAMFKIENMKQLSSASKHTLGVYAISVLKNLLSHGPISINFFKYYRKQQGAQTWVDRFDRVMFDVQTLDQTDKNNIMLSTNIDSFKGLTSIDFEEIFEHLRTKKLQDNVQYLDNIVRFNESESEVNYLLEDVEIIAALVRVITHTLQKGARANKNWSFLPYGCVQTVFNKNVPSACNFVANWLCPLWTMGLEEANWSIWSTLLPVSQTSEYQQITQADFDQCNAFITQKNAEAGVGPLEYQDVPVQFESLNLRYPLPTEPETQSYYETVFGGDDSTSGNHDTLSPEARCTVRFAARQIAYEEFKNWKDQTFAERQYDVPNDVNNRDGQKIFDNFGLTSMQDLQKGYDHDQDTAYKKLKIEYVGLKCLNSKIDHSRHQTIYHDQYDYLNDN